MPLFFKAAASNGSNDLEQLKAVPSVSTKLILESLGLIDATATSSSSTEATLDRFRFHNIVQGFMYPSRASRIDDAKQCMKMVDLVHWQDAEMEIANYISGQYRLDYEQRKTAKLKAERESLMKRHVAEIVSQQQSKQEAFDMLSRGIRRGAMELRIENPNSYGFKELRDALLDVKATIKDSSQAEVVTFLLSVILLGNYANCQWNQGKALFLMNTDAFQAAFSRMGQTTCGSK